MRGQRLAVLNELKAGNEVTNKSMGNKYGIERLSGIICDLRKMGYSIHTVMKDGKTRFGDSIKYGSYILGQDADEEE